MKNKLNILFIGNYNRKDYIDLLLKSKDEFNFFFLEFASPLEISSNYYKNYGECIFWKDFRDAFELIDKIKPDKVLFIFIEAYNHVALNLACRERNITTCILDHGVRDANINITHQATQQASSTSRQYSSKRISLFERLKTRLFLIRTMRKLSPKNSTFLRQYCSVRRSHNFFETSQLIQSPLRKPDVYLSFSPGIYEAHQRLDQLGSDQKVYFFGIPYFDELPKVRTGASGQSKQKNILFIDQAFVKQQLLGWNHTFKRAFVTELLALCSQLGYNLFVKTHPLEDKYVWLEFAGPNLRLVDADFHNAVVHSNIVMGFYSTLLLGLAALPHTSLITFEGHPNGNFSLSRFVTDQKVAAAIYDLKELQSLLQNPELLHQQQAAQKDEFIKKWLFKFDGRAAERLCNLLLQVL